MMGKTIWKVNVVILIALVLGMLLVLQTVEGYENTIRTYVPISPERLREFMDKSIEELDGC